MANESIGSVMPDIFSAQYYLQPQTADAVIYLAIALRAYTARHDPSLLSDDLTWLRLCVQAGIEGVLPPFPPIESDYSRLRLRDGYILELNGFEATRTRFWAQHGIFETFFDQYYHKALELAQSDALIRSLLHTYHCEYERIRSVCVMLSRGEESRVLPNPRGGK